MEILVEEFLAFARGEGTEEVSSKDIAVLVADVARSAHGLNKKITVETKGDLNILVRPNAIRRCITNLIVNACTHAKKVEISAERHGTFVEICVDDDGPGIPEHEREAVFKPFYRLDLSRILKPEALASVYLLQEIWREAVAGT